MHEKHTQSPKLSAYMESVHRAGKIGSVITIVAFVLSGIIICLHFDVMPGWSQFLAATIPVFITVVGGTIGEFFAYYPILGPGGTYIGFITGNINNMKIPSVVGAMQALDVKSDSEEFHILSIIAAVVSSIFVMLLLGIVVLFSRQIKPFLEWQPIQPAINNVLPAIFALLLVGPLKTQPKLCILTALLLVPVIHFLNPLTNSIAGIFGSMIIAATLSVIFLKSKERREKANS